MSEDKLLQRLTRKKVNMERIAAEVAGRPTLLPEIIRGLSADKAAVKFGSLKVLRIISERQPELLYPEIKAILGLLDSDNRILKWGGILITGNLAGVDSRGRITRILDKYLEPIAGPELVTAANTIGGAAKIALAKPRLTDRVVEALFKVERARYRTAECRNVALGKVVEALDQLYEHSKHKLRIKSFVKRQLKNSRKSTRNKAEKFVKKWV